MMHIRIKLAVFATVAAMLSLSVVACGQFGNLKARKLFKDANALYRMQEYKRAAGKYEEALQADPNLTTAYFYLGNSYDQLYKPSRQGEKENDEYLTKAVDNYKKAAAKEQNPQMRKLALQYLVAAYGPDKLNDASQAEPIVQRMIELDKSDVPNYFVLAKLYEDAGRYDEAEATLLTAKEVRPNDPAVYLQLAGYYNRQGEFAKTIEALEQRAAKEPNNPEAYYTIATYYWEKAFRDFRLTEPEKRDFVMKGLDAVNKALELKQDYMEAIVYKNILLRMQANTEKDPAKQSALIKEADRLRDRAQELRKQKVAGVGD
ncbi:MAG: tetratricopeptide repeat protein [Acidobacteria bacterium]|nr:tetratricopeptide repeat protein [Acidobacteriota bacterium]